MKSMKSIFISGMMNIISIVTNLDMPQTPSVTCWKWNVSVAKFLQGSVVMCLRSGEKYNKDLAADFLYSLTVEEFSKLVNIGQSYA